MVVEIFFFLRNAAFAKPICIEDIVAIGAQNQVQAVYTALQLKNKIEPGLLPLHTQSITKPPHEL